MTENDFRLNAYKKVSKLGVTHSADDKKKSEDISDQSTATSQISSFKPMSLDSIQKKEVKKPVFPVLSSNNIDQISKSNKSASSISSNVSKKADNLNQSFNPTRIENQPSQKSPIQNETDSIIKNRGFIKVPTTLPPAGEKESVYRRVAKFLLLVGVSEASKILPHLPQDQIEKIIPEIATIRNVSSDEAAVILAEFTQLRSRVSEGGGVNTARSILEQAFGSEKASEMLKNAVPFADGEPFSSLQSLDGEKLFYLLKDETSAVRAIVLSKLKPEKAASVINQLSPIEKKDTIFRLAKLGSISPDIIRRIDAAMNEKVEKLASSSSSVSDIDGRGALAEILKQMSPNIEKEILSSLEYNDPELSNDLRDRLFTLDDIINSDDKFIQTQLHSMSDADIAFLIAGKKENWRQKILQNISKGRAALILDEEKLRSPIKKADSDIVTNRFMAVLRRAWENGNLFISGRDDEKYV